MKCNDYISQPKLVLDLWHVRQALPKNWEDFVKEARVEKIITFIHFQTRSKKEWEEFFHKEGELFKALSLLKGIPGDIPVVVELPFYWFIFSAKNKEKLLALPSRIRAILESS